MSNPAADFGDQPPEARPDLSGHDPSGADDRGTLQQDVWRKVFAEAEVGLRRFLTGKLPQPADVEDCLQSVMVAMLRNETPIPASARRAWLFRVAANEAALWWRKKSTTDRVLEKHAHSSYSIDTAPPSNLETEETLQQVSRALSALPVNAQQVIRMRLHESMTFQAIADELNLPLGTVLTTMRRALQQLRGVLDPTDESNPPSTH